uniref:hypothetical protein n=1 Tax=Stephanopyxis turris TaxID=515487 RepID=UPI0022F2C901|nr:hypothetical protein PKF95_pgp117 [Stephanopyxis turris]WAJ57651.1 hypothetical protein [Stephanopyxis turris]
MYITINATYTGLLSNNAKILLKKIQHRSFSRATHLLSSVPDVVERNFLLQLLNSASSYLQNNYDANIVKIWVDNIYIKKQPKINQVILQNHKTQHLQFSYSILIEFAFIVEKLNVK